MLKKYQYKSAKFTLRMTEVEYRRCSTLFFNFGAKLDWAVNATQWPLYPREEDPGTH
jgi:hypothetical protein